MRKYFNVIISGESFKSSKPNPECYRITLDKLGFLPSETVIVEDSTTGIEAGKSMGCRVFAIKNYYGEKELSKADKIFKNHEHILHCLINAQKHL